MTIHRLEVTFHMVRSRLWGAGLVALASLLSCSDRPDTGSEGVARTSEALTSTQTRVLGFNGGLTGSAADWLSSTGSLAVVTSPKTEGTQAARTTLALSNGATKVTAKSIKLSTLGPIGDHATIQVFLPTALPANGWLGQVALTFNSPTSGIFSAYSGPVAFAGSLGAFHAFNVPIAPSVASALSSHTYSDLEITVEVTGPDASQHYVVDGLSFPPSSGGGGGSGGSGGTGGGIGGTSGSGGTSGQGGSASGGAGGGAGSASGASGSSGAGGATGSAGASGTSSSSGGSGSTGASGVSGPCTFSAAQSGDANPTTFSLQVPKGFRSSDFALAASGGSLTIADGVSVTTSAGSFASVSSLAASARTNIGVGSQVMSVYTAPLGVDLRNQAHVHGLLQSSADVQAQSGALVDSGASPDASITSEMVSWSVPFPVLNRGSCSVEPDNTQALTPGSYGDIAVKSRSHLRLTQGGAYYFSSLSFEPQSVLEVDNAAAAIVLYVKGAFSWSGALVPTRQDTGNVLFGVVGAASVQTAFKGILVAPNAALVLPSVSAPGHFGSFFAQSITAQPNTTINFVALVPGTFCSSASACSGLCPCDTGGTCNADADCSAGLVCGNNGPRFGRTASDKVCWNPACATMPTVLGCGTASSACGSVCTSAAACASDADCSAGSVCGKHNGDVFQSDAPNVCWPQICATAAAANCGDLTSPCGMCFCHPSCAGRACGDTTDDGCGGQCAATCSDHQPGCTSDSQCQAGSVCAVNSGSRLGLSSSQNVCLPARCADGAVDCGTTGDPCGLCVAACIPDCSGRSCGPDPVCGAPCGDCASGEICSDGGQCEAGGADPQVVAGGREVPPLPIPAAIDSAGATRGEFSVSDLGTATYSVPIEVPPGRNGIQPSLALSYASSTGDGALGIGWSLDGLSTIARCERRYALGETTAPVTGISVDAFCLDGERLIEVGRSSASIEFRTNVETFSKVVASLDNSALGPVSFRAYGKDGLIRDYGTTPDSSELYGRGAGLKRAWALSKVSDRAGNSMAISYTAVYADSQGQLLHTSFFPTATAELRPARIQYTQSEGIQGDRFVDFFYDARRRPVTGFVAGLPAIRDQLLTEIRVSTARAGAVRNYFLTYESSANGQQRLHDLKECAGSRAVCKRPTRFSYFDDSGFGAPEPLAAAAPFGMVFDQNADGRDDVLQTNLVFNGQVSTPLSAKQEGWIDTGAQALNFVYPGVGIVVAKLVHYFNIENTDRRVIEQWSQTPFLAQSTNPVLAQGAASPVLLGNWFDAHVTDLDANGIPEVINSFRNIYVPKPITALVNGVRVRTGSEYVPFGQYNPPQGFSATDFLLTADRHWFGDIDGDGIDDYLRCDVNDQTHIRYHLSDGAPHAFPASNEQALELGPYTNLCNINLCLILNFKQVCAPNTSIAEQVPTGFMFDLDGDGAQEFVFHDPSAGWVSLSHTPSLHFQPTLSGLPLEASLMYELDANGDGLRDLLHVSAPAGEAQLWLGTGRGLVPQPIVGGSALLSSKSPAFVLDVNRDGADDIVYEDPVLGWIGRSVDARTGTMPVVSFLNASGRGFFADIDNDGVADLINATSDGQASTVRRGLGRRQNLLRTVVEGTGRVLDVRYDQTATDGQPVYSATSQRQVAWPERLLPRPPQPLVSDYQEGYIPGYVPDFRTGTSIVERQFAYHYSAGHSDLAGYGFLGYENRQVVELFPNSSALRKRTTVAFHDFQRVTVQAGPGATHPAYAYPFLGRPVDIRVDYPLASSPLAASPLATPQDDTVLTWTLALSPQGRPFSFLQQAETAVTEGGLQAWREVLLQNVDSYGNATLAARGTLVDSVTERVSFDPTATEVDDWLIALPKSIQRTSTRNGETQTQNLSIGYLDHTDLPLATTRELGDPSLQLTTVFFRNGTGGVFRTEQISLSGARATNVDFDARQLFPISVTNALGQSSQVRLDDRFGTPERIVDPNGISVRRAYDNFGVLRQVEAPTGGGTTSYISASPYVAANALTVQSAVRMTVDGIDGTHMERDFDALGRVVRTSRQGFAGTVVDQELAYGQDLLLAIGRAHAAGDGSQATITMSYDPRDRETQESYPDGSSALFQYATTANIRSDLAQAFVGSTAASLVTVVFDRNGHVSATANDGLGLTLRHTDALLNHTDYRYGPFSSLRQITDVNGNLSQVMTDAYGRVLLSSDVARGTALETYDAFDQPRELQDSHGLTTFDFDSLGRPQALTDVDGTTSWTYDGTGPNEIGRLVSTTSPTGVTTTYGYEAVPSSGRNRGLLSHVARQVQGKTLTTSVTYDAASRPEITNYPAADGFPFAVRNHYDAFGNLTSVTDEVTQVRYWSWDEADQGFRIRKETQGNGAATSYAYETLTGRPSSLQTRLGASVLQDLRYEYDAVGNITMRTSGAESTRYAYDELDRLTTSRPAVQKDPPPNFSFDAVGNLLSKDGAIYSYSGPFKVASTGATGFDYDASGRTRIRSPAGASRQHIDYTAFDLPSQIAEGDSKLPIATFAYDARGSRAAKLGRTTSTLYAGDHYREDANAAAGSLRRHSTVFAGGRPVAQVSQSETAGTPDSRVVRYLHQDLLGSITAISKEDESLGFETRTYSPFGSALEGPLTGDDILLGFSGQMHDPELGLIDMKGRVYDPDLGRFLTPDPFTSNPTSQGLNPYAYVENNPTNYVDPSGFAMTPLAWTGFAAFTIGDLGLLAYANGWFEQTAGQVGSSFGGSSVGGSFSSATSSGVGYYQAKLDLTQTAALNKTYNLGSYQAAPRVQRQGGGPGGGGGAAARGSIRYESWASNTEHVPAARKPPSACEIGICLAQSVPGAEGGPGTETRNDGSGGTLTSRRPTTASAVPFVLRLPTSAEISAALAEAWAAVVDAFVVSSSAQAAALASPLLVPGDSVIVQATQIDPNKPADQVLPGSLRREFPGEHLGKSLNEIREQLKSATGQTKRSLQTAKKILEQAGRLLDKSKG